MPFKIFMVVFASLARVLPHIPNMTPVGAVGLYAGSKLPFWQAVLLTLVPMAIVDATFFGGYAFTDMLFVYLGLLGAPLMGRLMLSEKVSLARLGGGVLGSATFFFIVSNFGFFLSGYNGLTFAGLVKTYAMAIPFYGNSLAGDALYAAVIFGGAALIEGAAAMQLLRRAQNA